MAKIWRGRALKAAGPEAGGWISWSRGYAVGPDGTCHTNETIGQLLLEHRDRLADILTDLNGCFSAFLTDGGSAIIITDRFGTVPVYFCPDRTGSMAVADDPWSVIARLPQPPRILSAALIDMLHAGYVTGTETLIAEVETAAPATITRIDRRNVSTERYWNYSYRPEEMTEAAAVDELESVLRSVVQRSRLVFNEMGARPVLTLSGGLDSRLLAGLFASDGQVAPESVSYGADDDPEVAVAKEIVTYLQMKSRITPVGKDYLNSTFFAESTEEVGITTRLTCGIGARHLDIDSDQVLVPGHTGDFISGGHLPAQAGLVRNRVQLQRFLDLRHFRYPFSQRILQRVLNLDPAQRLDRMAHTTDAFDLSQDMFGLIDRWNVENRQRRLILMELRAYERKAPWVLPFYDYELVDFFTRVPHPLRFGQYLYVKTALERVFKAEVAALATIPRVGKPLVVDVSASARMQRAMAVPEILAKPALALLPAMRVLKTRFRGLPCATSGPDPLCHWYRTDNEARAFLNAKIRTITLAEIDSDQILELANQRNMPQEFFQRSVISAITAQEALNRAQNVWTAGKNSDT